MALVQCPCAFRLRWLAQSVFPVLGSVFLLSIILLNISIFVLIISSSSSPPQHPHHHLPLLRLLLLIIIIITIIITIIIIITILINIIININIIISILTHYPFTPPHCLGPLAAFFLVVPFFVFWVSSPSKEPEKIFCVFVGLSKVLSILGLI